MTVLVRRCGDLVIALLWIAPFVYVFAGGIAADLLESRYRRSTQVVLASFIGLQALLSFPLHW